MTPLKPHQEQELHWLNPKPGEGRGVEAHDFLQNSVLP